MMDRDRTVQGCMDECFGCVGTANGRVYVRVSENDG